MPPAERKHLIPQPDGTIRVAYDFTEEVDDVPVRFVFGEGQHGQLVCFRIEIGPDPDTPLLGKPVSIDLGSPDPLEDVRKFQVKPLTTQTLRRIPVASLIEWHFSRLASMIRDGEYLPHAHTVTEDGQRVIPDSSMRRLELELGRSAEKSAPSTRRPGRPPKYGPEHWQEVARVYLAHGGRAPRKAVAEHFDVPLRKADNWISMARSRGFLPQYREAAEPS